MLENSFWKAFVALHVDALWARQEILLPAQGVGGGGVAYNILVTNSYYSWKIKSEKSLRDS